MRILANIWKDPVWSKVISVAIIAVFTLIFNSLSAIIEDTSFSTAFINFWTIRIQLWITILSVFIIVSIIYTVKKPFKYDNETISLDRKLFNQIRDEKNMDDLALEIKTGGFSNGPVEMEKVQIMLDFLRYSNRTDFEFINPRLDRLKTNLIRELRAFDEILVKYISGTNHPELLSIPSEWEYEQPERMQEAVQKISNQENRFVKAYSGFISEGRRILKV